MRYPTTTLAACALSIGLLAGCTRTEVKREVVTLPCPMTAPARLCPMSRPPRPSPVTVFSCMAYAEKLEYGWDCWESREHDWQDLLTAPHVPH